MENIIIHCKTQEEANNVIDKLVKDEYNFGCVNIEEWKNYWHGYKKETCYNIIHDRVDGYCDIDWYKEHYKDTKIIEAKDFLGEEEILLNNTSPETLCSEGEKSMSIITNAFKSKENKALEYLGLGTTNELNEGGRAEFINYIFETGDTSKKGFLAKVVEIYKERKNK